VTKSSLIRLALVLSLSGIAGLTALMRGLDSGLVLCQGEDGHLEIEIAQAGKCSDCLVRDDHGNATGKLLAPADADHCGDCVDTFLGKCGETQPQKRRAASAGFALAVPSLSIASFRPHFLVFCRKPSPALTTARTFLRTIRLII